MNSSNILKNINKRFIQLSNNSNYQDINQYYCPICHSSMCFCNNNNKNIYNSKKSQIIYNSFNTDIDQTAKQSINFNNNSFVLNKLTIKSFQTNNFGRDKSKKKSFSPSFSNDLEKKERKHNFEFYHNKENQTIYQKNTENNVKQINLENYSNISNNKFFSCNKSNFNMNTLNFSGSGMDVSYYYNINKNKESFNNYQKKEINNLNLDSILTNNENRNNKFNEKDNSLSLEKQKSNKIKKLFNKKHAKDCNKISDKGWNESYANILKKSINLYEPNMNRVKSSKNNMSSSHFINMKHKNNFIISNYSKNSGSSKIKIKNNDNSQSKNMNLINSFQNYQSHNQEINLEPNGKSLEIIKNYNSNYSEKHQNFIKNDFIKLRKKNFDLSKKKTIYSENTFEKKTNDKIKGNNQNRSIINKFFINRRLNRKNIVNRNIDINDSREKIKENISNNINYEDNEEKSYNQKMNIKISDKLKSKNKIIFENNTTGVLNTSNLIKDYTKKQSSKQIQIEDKSKNLNIEINNYKKKTKELITLLKKANNEINELKLQLNDYKKNNNNNNNNKIPKNKKEINLDLDKINCNYSKKIIQHNRIKNSLKLKMSEGNIYSKNIKKKDNDDYYDLDIISKKLSEYNIEKLNNNKNKLILNKINKNYNSNNNTNLYINKINEKNKYIFSLYYSKNKNFKKSILCFDAETKLFKMKNLDNTKNSNNFNKDFFESFNKKDKLNNSIYLINDNNYYIVTGENCNKFYEYNFKEEKIKQLLDLKYSHSNGGMIYYCNKIICLSGDLNKKVELYSKNENTWIELPEMQIERSFFSSSIVNNRYLFVFFGYNFNHKKYLSTIEYFDFVNYNISLMNMRINTNKNNLKTDKPYNLYNNNFWRNLNYNFFDSKPPFNNINLIGSIAVNYNNEKIIFLGGKNGFIKDKEEGYYQLILDDTNINNNNNEMIGYIEKIKTKGYINYNKYYFKYDYKYIEELDQDNILKEPVFVAFDNNYYVHLIKLSTMNHEIYNFNK